MCLVVSVLSKSLVSEFLTELPTLKAVKDFIEWRIDELLDRGAEYVVIADRHSQTEKRYRADRIADYVFLAGDWLSTAESDATIYPIIPRTTMRTESRVLSTKRKHRQSPPDDFRAFGSFLSGQPFAIDEHAFDRVTPQYLCFNRESFLQQIFRLAITAPSLRGSLRVLDGAKYLEQCFVGCRRYGLLIFAQASVPIGELPAATRHIFNLRKVMPRRLTWHRANARSRL